MYNKGKSFTILHKRIDMVYNLNPIIKAELYIFVVVSSAYLLIPKLAYT